MYSGFSGWLISPNYTSPQEVEVTVPGPTQSREEALWLLDTNNIG